jgi:hypothetical protein
MSHQRVTTKLPTAIAVLAAAITASSAQAVVLTPQGWRTP